MPVDVPVFVQVLMILALVILFIVFVLGVLAIIAMIYRDDSTSDKAVEGISGMGSSLVDAIKGWGKKQDRDPSRED